MNTNAKIQFAGTKEKINYSVMLTMHENDVINTMKYEMSVQCLAEEVDNHFLFQLNKISKTFINDEEVNEIADELAERTARTIFPLILMVNKKGEWKEVYNAEEIKSRWQKNKIQILQEYQGKFVTQYLKLATKKLESKEQIKNALEKDFFLCSFFRPVYANVSYKMQKALIYHFPLLPQAKCIAYSIQQKQYLEKDAFGFIRIEQNGELNDETEEPNCASQQKIEKRTGHYKSTYYLNEKDHHIDSVIVESSLQTEVETKVQILISAIENE
jgi:hypothetical protein